MTPDRLARLERGKPVKPIRSSSGTARYVTFWSVVSECIQAEIARRGND